MKTYSNKNIGKREFIKRCGLSISGCMLGFHGIKSFRWTLASNDNSKRKSDDLSKWSKEALFYTKVSDGLKCQKCPHECLLSDNESGFCRSRVNRGGKLYSIAYGNPCAVHVDPIEKKPFYHFLPTTKAFSIAVAGCNFRCLNCQNWQISQFSPEETENFDLMPDKIVEQCLESKCESIAYTYSEPTTFYEYAYDTAKLARETGIKNLLKSNGYINEAPLRKLCKVLDAANIDLKIFNDDTYSKLSTGKLEPVLKTLIVLEEEGVWLEITNLVIPNWTDNLDTIKRMCVWLVKNKLQDCPLHFSRFTPLYKLTQLPLTPIQILEKARNIALEAGIKYVYIGNIPAHQAENTYCSKCKKIIIERKGFTIQKNHLNSGKCMFCGETISGVWGNKN
jgi:pyruvate formate lyase activating enzyme